MPANAGASVFSTFHLARRVSIREVVSCGPSLSLLVHARFSSSSLRGTLRFSGTSPILDGLSCSLFRPFASQVRLAAARFASPRNSE